MKGILILVFFFFISCKNNHKVEKGDEVFLAFKLFNEEGTVIDGSHLITGFQPLRIVAGEKFLFQEFDSLLLDMYEHEQKKVTLSSNNIYSSKGVFYKNAINDSVFLIKKGERLTLEIEVNKIIKHDKINF